MAKILSVPFKNNLGYSRVNGNTITLTGGDYSTLKVGNTNILELTTAGNYTLEDISDLASTNFWIKISNNSGGVATIIAGGSDTIEGVSSIDLSVGETRTYYISGTDFKL